MTKSFIFTISSSKVEGELTRMKAHASEVAGDAVDVSRVNAGQPLLARVGSLVVGHREERVGGGRDDEAPAVAQELPDADFSRRQDRLELGLLDEVPLAANGPERAVRRKRPMMLRHVPPPASTIGRGGDAPIAMRGPPRPRCCL